MNTTVCKCGRKIAFAENISDPKKGKVPVDLSAPCYQVEGEYEDGTPIVRRWPNAVVNHFATCSLANQFSKKGKGDAA